MLVVSAMEERPTTDPSIAHGFRSMASTLLNELGFNRDWIERQLAHGERDKVLAAYNYAEHLPERRKMMQAWADYLDQLRCGANVIRLVASILNALGQPSLNFMFDSAHRTRGELDSLGKLFLCFQLIDR
jgi:hypothetical protein